MRTVLYQKPLPEKPVRVQPKLTINPPGDRFEREADRVADQVVGAGTVQRQVDTVQDQEVGGIAAPPSVQEAVSSSGQPLDPATRGIMEERFGHDFGRVRVHSDARAAESARQIDASAYTLGSDIVFGAGRYETGTAAGQRLLAHELTHVVQQTGGGPAGQTVQRQPAGSAGSLQVPDVDLRQNMTPSMASALGSAVVDSFAVGSAKIPTAGEAALRSSAENILYFLQKYPGSTVQITGHTDTLASEARNLTLGQERADAVKAFLVKEGVPEEIITTDSKGETSLAVPTKDEVDQPLNRRANVYFRANNFGASLGLPKLETKPEEPKKPVNLDVGQVTLPPTVTPPVRPPTLWDTMEENQRKIKEYDRKNPKKDRSLSDVVIDGVMENAVTPILKGVGLSDKRRKQAEELIRKGLEKGTEKACEASIDALDIGATEKEALKAACKAAIKKK